LRIELTQEIESLYSDGDRNALAQLLEVARGSNEDNSSISSIDFQQNRLEPAAVGVPNLHPIVVHESFHCPPFGDIAITLGDSLCDCSNYGDLFDPCCKFWGPNDGIDWEAEMNYASQTVNDQSRPKNNIMRKRLYRKVYRQCNIGDERGSRTELSVCAVAKVRQIYPSASGDYMGYLAS